MRFNFYSHGEKYIWDHRVTHMKGCGGSETSHIELSARLARMGHEVHSYAPIPEDCPPDPSGVIWHDERDFLSAEYGIWIVNRIPCVIPEIPAELGPVWLICHDIAYQDWESPWMDRVTRIVALGTAHAELLKKLYAKVADKVCMSGNGIDSKAIEAMPVTPRNPHACVFASAPERGLLQALEIHSRVREIVADAELHVYYGFQNFDENFDAKRFAHIIREVDEAKRRVMSDPGVVFHGQVPKRELYEGWLLAGIWMHPTQFLETNCITAQEAQACGAIPVTNLIWGIKDNVKYGIGIEGMPRDCSMTRARYVQEVAGLMMDSQRQAQIRHRMRAWALNRFDWQSRAEEWESWAVDDMTDVNTLCVMETAVA